VSPAKQLDYLKRHRQLEKVAVRLGVTRQAVLRMLQGKSKADELSRKVAAIVSEMRRCARQP